MLFLGVGIMLTPMNGFGQTNLIINGDCEDFTSCPVSNSEIDSLNFFHNFQICGTSDYINQCGSGPWAGIPNIFGNQQPHSGNGYIHSALVVRGNFNGQSPSFIGQFGPYYCQQRENILGTLSDTLLKSKCYEFEVYINFGRYDTCGERLALGDFNVIFLDSLFHPIDAVPPSITENNFDIIDLNPSKQIINDTNNWISLKATFKAKGGEKYFAFGTFVDTTQLHIEYINCSDSSTGAASYFFDDFSLVACNGCCLEDEVYDDHLVIASNPGTTASPTVFTSYLNGNTTATLEIFDSAGRLVATDHQQNLYNTFTLPPLAAAVYHYRFQTSNGVDETGKVVVE